MRKNKLKHLLLLFLFAFTVWGCDDDYYEKDTSHNHNLKEYKIKKYTYNQASKLKTFIEPDKIIKSKLNLKLSSLKKLKKLKSENAFAKEPDMIFAIDSSLIKQVCYGDLTSYTMLIVLDSVDYSNGSFDNLVIKTNQNNETEAFVIHYQPSSDIKYNTDHKSYIFEGITSISKVYGIYSFFENGNNNTPGSNDGFYGGEVGGSSTSSIICVDVLKCNGTKTGGVGPVHNAGPGCGQTFTVIECSSNPNWNPYSTSGGGGESENPLGNDNNNNGPGGGGLSSGPDNYDTTDNNSTTTSTVFPQELDENGDDCSLFTNLQSDFEVKSAIEYMKTQTNGTIEVGICLSATETSGQYNPIIGEPDENLDFAVGYDIPNGTVVDILIHTHYTGGLSIFSPDDLQQIYIMMKNPNITIPDNFTSIVVTPDNEVFAMTISSKASFLAFGDKWFPNDDKFYAFRATFYNSFGFNINGNNTNGNNEINFLKMLGSKSGIKLYKANSDLSQWNNLKLNSTNNSVTPISPCN